MTADAWVNTGALLNRMNFAVQMLAGGQPQRMGGPGRGGQGPPDQAQPQRQLGGRQGRGALEPRPGQLQRGPIQVDVRTLAPDTSEETIDRVIDTVLGGQASDGTRQTISRATTPQQLLALALGSPEFQKR
jgi:uncharacterized protein (DUF1800 family)